MTGALIGLGVGLGVLLIFLGIL
ncbi:MAG: hypothetical protein RLZ94_1819, partial [Actinomycetota bacterium]